MTEVKEVKKEGTVPLPPVLFLSCLVAGGLLQLYRPFDFVLTSFVSRLLCALVLFGGAVLLIASALLPMQRAGTTHHPTGTPSALITSGPFRFSRNPLYVSLLLMLAGFAALLNSVWLLLTMPVLFLLLNGFVIPREEAVLGRLFGEEYTAYRGRVRRWL
ncbi:MAG TPA: isoprenylcysteine carboxylmethyltransferase family protein [Thermoanaerobaculia bacterium]|nr:isoprenylcysteine carboxylmethyltransferase family protein [Thermoanaerobaculia bacterium]